MKNAVVSQKMCRSVDENSGISKLIEENQKKRIQKVVAKQ